MPKEIKEIKGKEKNNWIECNEEGANVHLYSYFFKTKLTEMRNVLLLHTTKAAHYVTNDEKKTQTNTYTTLLQVLSTYPINECVPLLVSKKQEMETFRISLCP